MVKKQKTTDESKVFDINEYKDEIDKYIKERVEVESASQSVKLLKKQLKNKKISSGIKSFIILCLLACIGSGLYYLYNDGYFDEDKKETTKCNCPINKCDEINDNKKDTKDDNEKESLDNLKSEYGYLLDNIIFDANSNYTSDYYNGKLTDELKEYLSYKLIDQEEVLKDEDSLYFEADALKNAYNKLFDGEINLKNFKYNNASFTYLEPKDMFISNLKANDEKLITREIIDISVDKKEVIITCVEGYINGKGKLFNIVNNKEVTSFKANESISKYKDKLNVIKYTFNDEYLTSIEK